MGHIIFYSDYSPPDGSTNLSKIVPSYTRSEKTLSSHPETQLPWVFSKIPTVQTTSPSFFFPDSSR